MRKQFYLCLILWWAVSTSAVFGQSVAGDVVVLPSEISGAIDLRSNAKQWRSPRDGATLELAQQAWDQGLFLDPSLQSPGRSMTQDAIWYRVVIANPNAVDHLVHFVLGANFLVFSQAAIEQDGAVEVIFTESNRQSFSERAHKTPRLASRAFEIPANSETILWVGIVVDGSSDIGQSLMTPDDLAAAHLTLSNLQTAFYVSVAFIGLFMLGFLFVYFSWAQFFYFAFFLILAAYNAQLSGLMFQWVWPNAPWWNGYASHFIGLSGIMCAAWAAWLFVSAGSRRRPVFRIASFIFQGIGFLAMAAPFVLPLVTVKALLGPVVLIFLIVQFWGAFIALRDRLDGSYIIAAASVILVVYLGIFTIGSQFEGLIPKFWIVLVLHFGPLLDGVLRFSSTVLQSYRMKQQQAEGSRRLALMQDTLEAVRHDMRQPLGTMRMSLEGVEQGVEKGAMRDNLSALRQSLDYLEGVIDQTGTEYENVATADTDIDGAENAPVNLYLNCLRRMFTQEAASKGIDLRIVPSSAFVHAPPLDLTRIMSNLVHNSIRHSKGDKIVIGVRHTDGAKVLLQIVDNGIGYKLPDPSKADTSRPRTKHGNGLRITSEMAQNCGIGMKLASRPGRMTTMILSVPRARTDE